jgi:glutamate carboxypeptidase
MICGMKTLWIALLGLLLHSSARADLTPPYLDLLKQIVEINSASENTGGSKQVRDVLRPHFLKLGFTEKRIALEGGHELWVMDFPGEKVDLLLVGHLDTVFPASSPFQTLQIFPDRLVGPGVIDMKGGVILLLQALAELGDPALLKKVRILLNDDEEIGSLFSKAAIHQQAEGIRRALVFEPGRPGGAWVTSHSGLYWFEMAVTGKASHAGQAPEKGVNACVDLSRKITELAKLTRLERGFSVSPDVIQGGTKTNIVCDSASVKVDSRYRDPKDLNALRRRLDELKNTSFVKNASGEVCVTDIKSLNDLPAMTVGSTRELFQQAQAVGKKLGIRVVGEHAGYGSDANHLAPTGMSLLVGLGPWGDGMHSNSETIELRAYSERLIWLKEYLKLLLK